MFKFFNATKEDTSSEVENQSAQHENETNGTNQTSGEKKKVHGEDGVCCGGCGGE